LTASQATQPDKFCPAFGPSNSLLGEWKTSSAILGSPSQRLLQIEFRARRNYLETFLPSTESRISFPGGWGKAYWVIRHIQSTEWKGNVETTVVGLCIPDAILSPGQNDLQEYVPIIFCDNADFVITAREELLLPILFVDIKQTIIASFFQMSLERSGRSFMKLSSSLSQLHMNGSSTKDVFSKSAAEVICQSLEALEAVFPGFAHIVYKLQGLDYMEPVATRLPIFHT
jgi:hypothetical protein